MRMCVRDFNFQVWAHHQPSLTHIIIIYYIEFLLLLMTSFFEIIDQMGEHWTIVDKTIEPLLFQWFVFGLPEKKPRTVTVLLFHLVCTWVSARERSRDARHLLLFWTHVVAQADLRAAIYIIIRLNVRNIVTIVIIMLILFAAFLRFSFSQSTRNTFRFEVFEWVIVELIVVVESIHSTRPWIMALTVSYTN